jgi:uncharacterized membrane protein
MDEKTEENPSSDSYQLKKVQYLKIHTGLLPSPETLFQYEKACPGCAERVISMAEKEQKMRHDMNRKYIYGFFLGQICAFIVGISGIICGTIIMINGHSIAGFSTFLATLTTLVAVYMYNKKGSKVAQS